jgi:preprotein translocase subunit SecE
MDLTKLFQKKNDDRGRRSGQGQRTELAKKGGQKPVKAKKGEGVKKAVPKKSDEPQTPWWEHLQQYLREVVYELRRVVWPSRKETLGSTSVVLVIVLLCGVFLGIVDLILSRLMRVFVG